MPLLDKQCPECGRELTSDELWFDNECFSCGANLDEVEEE